VVYDSVRKIVRSLVVVSNPDDVSSVIPVENIVIDSPVLGCAGYLDRGWGTGLDELKPGDSDWASD
jgi:hypothetical protein